MGLPVVTIQRNGQVLKSLTLESGEALLGRGEGCVIRLDDRAVSRQHAVIKSGPSGLIIEKKSHLAPLRVNGAECESAVLKEGDEVLIGPYLLRIDLPPDTNKGSSDGDGSYDGLSSVASSASGPSGATAIKAVDAMEPGDSEVQGASDPLSSSGMRAQPLGQEPRALARVEFGEAQGEHSHHSSLNHDSIEAQREELSSFIDEDAKTRILPDGSIVKLKLKFTPGAANVELQEFDQEEVSIGRGRGCDIILNDKKASRKHLIIRRQGAGVDTVFTIRDLESANGVFVNGARISEHVLSGDDVVRVGDTEFLVQAVLPNFEKQSEDFLKVDNNLPIHERSKVLQGMARVGDVPFQDGHHDGMRAPDPSIHGAKEPNGSLSNIGGIAGISGNASASGGLLDRYKALPPRIKVYGLVAIVLAILLFFPDEQPKSKKGKGTAQSQTAGKNKAANQSKSGQGGGLVSFDQLTPELQKFVESQHNLAMEYFRNQDFDKALYEVRKIFQYVSDYRDARDIERYCLESKQRLQAQEEERRRKELEQETKARVAKIIIEVEGHMARKEYVQARELFAEIAAL
ncbi:MAG: FHA domain-containing protein, partial [Bdellovibrionales bacterium]|nr:FHA domain-containing protein [Bdellovibrionales bacterium]